MDFATFIIVALVLGLFACMTADFILDCQSTWNSQLELERGSGRVQDVASLDNPHPIIATLDWVKLVEESEPIEEVDVIQLAKSRMKSRPAIKAGVKVRKLLDNLGKQVQQLVDYSQLTIRELKAIAKERRLPKYGSMRKADLIAALQNRDYISCGARS